MSCTSQELTEEVVIAGGGIGGLVTALSLHEAGFAVRVFEAVESIRALGVGINLLPHAVRELDALGLLDALRTQSVSPTTLAYFNKFGSTIWTEPRGEDAGYAWPQLSIHRGVLQTTLLEAVLNRIGADRMHTGHSLRSFESDSNGVTACFARRDGTEVTIRSAAMIACDGIHSAARAQLFPNEGMPKWNGAKLWRGVAEMPALLDGRTMVWSGHPGQKFIAYPIADLNPANDLDRQGPTGTAHMQLVNFIAELRESTEGGLAELAEREDWNQPGVVDDYLPAFRNWNFDWCDVPTVLRSAPQTFLFPMVDRDPVNQWSYDCMTLLGDAAHPMYPVGSNGASQAILDARTLAGCMRTYQRDIPLALKKYDDIRRPATAAIVLANRGFGPELPMNLVEERAPNGFTDVNDVITPEEVLTVTEAYRRTAGFAVAALSDPNAPSLLDADY
jgi:5-methylphenazine-1-carboxylate 1-monooxygenase